LTEDNAGLEEAITRIEIEYEGLEENVESRPEVLEIGKFADGKLGVAWGIGVNTRSAITIYFKAKFGFSPGSEASLFEASLIVNGTGRSGRSDIGQGP
jgi:hypothetical protein